MTTLVKMSKYYYVVSDTEEIKQSYYLTKDELGYESGILQTDENHRKVIATNNPLIPLPQITNASDELVGKEVAVWNKLNNTCILKPILKEIEPTNYDDGICNTVYRELNETSTNEVQLKND